MVDINPINPQSVTITTPSTNTVNLSTISNGTQNANTNADAQLAYAWACGNGLIQGIDYSSKHYAQEARNTSDSLLANEDFINVTNHLENITAVSNDLTNIDILAENITTYNNLLLYEEIEE